MMQWGESIRLALDALGVDKVAIWGVTAAPKSAS